MYKIKINYTTGNSFNSYEEIEYLDGSWEDIKIVEENIKRISEHANWYESKNSYSTLKKNKLSKPEFSIDEYSVKLLLDDRAEYQIHTFWCGYFETLNEVECEVELPKYSRR